MKISWIFMGVLSVATLSAQEKKTEKPPLNSEAAKLDLANTVEGSIPGGSSIVTGKWSVDAGTKKLLVAPEPLVDAWLEFGPEIREKGATIVASGRAPGEGRLQSRFGVGLYGKNGFQLRVVPARQQIELVRRGEVLLSKPVAIEADKLHHLELSVIAERQHWIVSGRAWPDDGKRPAKALVEHKVFSVELLFPLAGRSLLFATPFSGEPVAFASAMVYHGAFVEEAAESAPPRENAPF